MEHITPNLLQTLLQPNSSVCLSLYMPTFKTSPDSKQNPIRFQNLIKQARHNLESSNLVNHRIKVSLDKVATMVNDDDYWMHQKSGLAVFVCETYRLFLRLPLKFPESIYLNQHFNLKPLLPLITTNGKFYILTLSHNNIKLYQATRDTIDKISLGDIPTSLEDIIDPNDLRTHLQFHTRTSGQSGGQRQAVYHGQGGAGDKNIKVQLTKFLRLVASGIDQLLIDQKAPLILCGVEYLTSIFTHHSRYPHILDSTIDGSPDQTSKTDIHTQAWKLVRPVFKLSEQQALNHHGSLKPTGKTSTDLAEILPAAFAGRIQDLFVLRDHTIWGLFDPESGSYTLTNTNQPGTDDLMNLATVETLINSGHVFSLKPKEMIPNTPIAATYRY